MRFEYTGFSALDSLPLATRGVSQQYLEPEGLRLQERFISCVQGNKEGQCVLFVSAVCQVNFIQSKQPPMVGYFRVACPGPQHRYQV